MSDKVDISRLPEYSELKEQLKKIDWMLDYGSIKVQLRGGKPTLIIVEQTLKLD